jgi:hypothetical protein
VRSAATAVARDDAGVAYIQSGREIEVMTSVAPTSLPSSLYKYVGIESLLRIMDGSIRFTQPSAFNDPFELLPDIIVPNDAPERQISVSFHSGGPPSHSR